MRVEMREEMLEEVYGGRKYYHEGCGGNLWHAGNKFLFTKCSKCNKEFYFDSDFENVIATDDGEKFIWVYRWKKTCEGERYYGDTSIYH